MTSPEVSTSSCRRQLASGRDGLVPNDTHLHDNKIMRAVDQIARGAGRLGLPLYSNERSKRSFTQHQLLVLVVLRQLMARSYRGFIDRLSLMTVLWHRLGLRTMPHFTTLQKFSMRNRRALARWSYGNARLERGERSSRGGRSDRPAA